MTQERIHTEEHKVPGENLLQRIKEMVAACAANYTIVEKNAQ